MKNSNKNYPTNLGYPIISFALLLFSWNTSAEADTVAQTPLFLTTSVKPNVMLMVDNSGSMKENVTVTSSGTDYDPAIKYLSTVDCNSNALPSSTTSTAVDRSLNTRSKCENAGGSWNRRRDECTVTVATPKTYGTTIPTDFFGNVTGSGRDRKTGKLCFADNLTYTTSGISIPADVNNDAERANYLNWYYNNEINKEGTTQTRLQIAKDAATSLVDSLTDDVRLGLSTFGATTSDPSDTKGGKLLEVIDDLTDTKKSNINNRISALTATSWTPLAETEADIGRYFATGYTGSLTLHPDQPNESSQPVSSIFPKNLDDGTNWSGRTAISGEPTFSTSPIQYSCQKSFAVLITDGQPTQDKTISSYLQDYDGDCKNASPACGSYDKKPNYTYDSSNGTDYFDDVSQALYDMDLRPDLTKTSGLKNNVTTYTIGMADDAINPTLPGVNPLLKDAAIQGGGKFYFAGSASELNASLNTAFSIITAQAASSSSVATNSTQFQTDTLIYQATFNSTDWGGHILAFRLTTEDTNGNGELDSGEDVNGNGKIDAGDIGNEQWDAAVGIPPPSARNIFTYNPQASTDAKGIEFLWSQLNDTQKTILDSANVASANSPILDYLRGSNADTVANGGEYRNRTNVLGDIVNSDPLYVAHEDKGYRILPGAEGSSYSAFIGSTRRDMIYIGSNDGMLHGFDAGLTSEGGKEIFAFVPNAAISSELATLINPNYTHKYFVDGSPQAGDVYYDGAWHTVLVGSMGAGSTTTASGPTGLASGVGGRSVFALDITDPDLFDVDKVLWEYSSRDDADLGYTIPQASVVRMANGQWAAIVANGYNSSTGNTVLFIFDIKTGSLIKKITAATGGGNGLSSPVTMDVDGDSIVDYIYAGDLNGNMWKFDVSSNLTSDWGVAYSGQPLYIAADNAAPPERQPITTKPAVSKANGNGQTSGVMVYFGTGQYFETGDNVVPTDPQVQSFYAIWDICDKTSSATCDGSVLGRSLLQEQAIEFEGSTGTITLSDGSTTSGDVRVTSQCEVSFDSSIPTTTDSPCTTNINRRGWFLDFISPGPVTQGERAVSAPVLRNDRVIFTTLIPITTTCSPGGTSWLMELDQHSGSRLGGTPIDLNGDGRVNDADLVLFDGSPVAVSGLKSTVGIIKTPAIISCEKGLDCKYASGSSSGLMTVKESAPTDDSGGGGVLTGKRISWRQLR
ncbi:MAG: pilus assembly protein [Methylosarcina sp.]